jgi:hypothetical protein
VSLFSDGLSPPAMKLPATAYRETHTQKQRIAHLHLTEPAIKSVLQYARTIVSRRKPVSTHDRGRLSY